jgi:hypothetical protein
LEHFIDLLVNELGMCEGRWLVGAVGEGRWRLAGPLQPVPMGDPVEDAGVLHWVADGVPEGEASAHAVGDARRGRSGFL